MKSNLFKFNFFIAGWCSLASLNQLITGRWMYASILGLLVVVNLAVGQANSNRRRQITRLKDGTKG
jgi:uncharacterized protein (DUF58 family)